MEKNQNKTQFPTSLELGMRVTAVCMGREIGNYIVTGVGKGNATIEIEDSPDEGRIIIVKRTVGPNGLVTVLNGGINIQATDYFVKPYERA